MTSSKKLTKSRFAIALTCPTQVFYSNDKRYANQLNEDDFLASLAEGGLQVGELAKLYFDGGHEVTTLNELQAVHQTNELLKNKNVVIFEAALTYDKYFIRVDILHKQGSEINLFEVKAKSYDGRLGIKQFLSKNGQIKSSWKPYIHDVAFQRWVAEKALSAENLKSYLMLADKSKKISRSGLNKKFRIKVEGGRKLAYIDAPVEEEFLDPPIITAIQVDELCDSIYSQALFGLNGNLKFSEFLEQIAKSCQTGTKLITPLGSKCGSCPFHRTENDLDSVALDGRLECFKHHLECNDDIFSKPTIFDLWNFKNKEGLIANGKIQLKAVRKSDISVRATKNAGLSNSQRQWLQVEKHINQDDTPFIDLDGIEAEMSKWEYPYHFIDFETTMAAIPFTKGRRPYESVAFQFSHHVLDEYGTIEHVGEFLSTDASKFPNYDFLRALKMQLEVDQGTVFQYSHHESSILKLIARQLMEEDNPPSDFHELIHFTNTLIPRTHVEFPRNTQRYIVDLLDVITRYYYSPLTNGSNSIKQVLPAMITHSHRLKEKYSAPIYGAKSGIVSKNFKNKSWVKILKDGSIMHPYDLLSEFTDENQQDHYEIKNGGEALTTYCRMQYEETSELSLQQYKRALLRYCELDTLAMVMIVEGLQEHLNGRSA